MTKLKLYRVTREITARAVGEATRVCPSHISAVERRRQAAGARAMAALAGYYGLPVEALFDDRGLALEAAQ